MNTNAVTPKPRPSTERIEELYPDDAERDITTEIVDALPAVE